MLSSDAGSYIDACPFGPALPPVTTLGSGFRGTGSKLLFASSYRILNRIWRMQALILRWRSSNLKILSVTPKSFSPRIVVTSTQLHAFISFASCSLCVSLKDTRLEHCQDHVILQLSSQLRHDRISDLEDARKTFMARELDSNLKESMNCMYGRLHDSKTDSAYVPSIAFRYPIWRLNQDHAP